MNKPLRDCKELDKINEQINSLPNGVNALVFNSIKVKCPQCEKMIPARDRYRHTCKPDTNTKK